MKRWAGLALAVAGGVALSSCDQSGKAPTGQVVATVGHREITMRDLRAELGGYKAPDPKTLKAAESTALRNIIGRDVLAEEARKEKLDKTPDFAIAKQRAIDSLLVEALQKSIASQVPAATTDDAQRFMQDHPDIFGQRKIFMPRPSDANLIKALEPLKTFDQIQALLTSKNIPFKRVETSLDAVGADPRLVAAIVKLPPGELFVLPSGQIITVNLVKDTKVVPFTGDKAVAFAQQFLTRQNTQQAVQRRVQQLFAEQEKMIKYSKDFAPTQTPTPTPAPAADQPAAPDAPASGAR
jgi:EpsD family peptidyl-prolyl cis-trans isomerase